MTVDGDDDGKADVGLPSGGWDSITGLRRDGDNYI